MASIHAAPKLVYLRPDGEDGLDLVIATPDGATLVQPPTAAQSARFLNQLSEFVERKFRQMEKIG